MFTDTQNSTERLSAWREFRKTPFATPQELVTQFESMQAKPRYIDYYTPSTWPNMFEIVSDGLFCQSGITLLLTATLQYYDFIKPGNLRFDAISNHITGQDGLILVYDGLCYNFTPGKIETAQYVKNNSTCYDSHIITTDNLFA